MAEPCHGASMNSMNLTRTNQAFTKNRLGSIAAAKREQHFRSLYLQLTKEVILNNIYEPGPHIDEGCQWAAPQGAHHDRPEALGQRPRTRRAAPRSIDSRRSDRDRCLARRGDNFHACILKAYDVHDRRVADSFRGIPPIDPQKYPADSAHEGMDQLEILSDNSADRVRENFRRMQLLDDQVVFLEGRFKDTLSPITTDRLALMRLDGDLYESTMDAFVNLYPKLSPGGYVIVDDMCLEGCAKAVADYRQANAIADRSP